MEIALPPSATCPLCDQFEQNRRKARAQSRTRCGSGMLEDGRSKNDFFDVIRLSNVFERLPKPNETSREIQRILKSEGIVYLTVPNTRSPVFCLFRENWYALEALRHVIS
jgi:ubiquinone/menaquinone biosynthesis C-methylase UbiE